MQIVLCFLCLAIAVLSCYFTLAHGDTCTPATISAEPSAPCGPDSPVEFTLCKIGMECRLTGDLGYRCRSPTVFGQACSKDSDCGDYYENLHHTDPLKKWHCIARRCYQKQWAGETCKSNKNEQCITNACKSGICRGLPAGSACDPSQYGQCDKGLFCDIAASGGPKCSPTLPLGASCGDRISTSEGGRNEAYVACGANAVCDLGRNLNATAVCKPILKGAPGTSCGSYFGNMVCQHGLTCRNDVCTSVTSDFACINTPSVENAGMAQCPLETHRCMCKDASATKGSCLQVGSTECDNEYEELLACTSTNQCNLVHASRGDPDDCINNACAGAFCRAQNCLTTGFPATTMSTMQECIGDEQKWGSIGAAGTTSDAVSSAIASLVCVIAVHLSVKFLV